MTMAGFDKIAIIGLGLIGSSIAHAARRGNLARQIVGFDASADVRTRAAALGFCDAVAEDAPSAVADAELVFLCVPVGACGSVTEQIAPRLPAGAILTDVGSVKGAVIRDVVPHLPAGVHFIPAHPIAGTEFSGPEGSEKEVVARYRDFAGWFKSIDLAPEGVHLSGRYAWSVKLNNGMTVELGREQTKTTLKDRVERLISIYPQLAARLQNKIESVDMRYPNGLALKAEGLAFGMDSKKKAKR